MDENQKLESIDNIISLLEVSNSIESEDKIRLYLSRAINFVKNYCKITEIPVELFEVVEDIAVFRFRGKGAENLKSEGKGSLSESYMESLPVDIINQLNCHRKVRVI